MITKPLLIAICILASSIAYGDEKSILGTFESVRLDQIAGLPESITEKTNAAFERTKQTLTITVYELVLKVMGSEIKMSYTKKGEFLLGKVGVGGSDMYYPIYVENSNTLFLMGQKFVRIEVSPRP